MAIEILKSIYKFPDKKPSVKENHQTWMGHNHKFVFDKFLKNKGFKIVLELGTWMGGSAKYMLGCDPEITIICCDNWLGSLEHHLNEKERAWLPTLYETFLANCYGWKDRIIPLRMDSYCGIQLVKEYNIQPYLIYIDAAHDYKTVKRDLEECLCLFPNAIIVGDDWLWEEVRKAVQEVTKYINKKEFVVRGNCWYLVR